jgi:hypothetical protein
MIEAQNLQNGRPNNRQKQAETYTQLSAIDSIVNVCSQEVSAIRNDLDTLRLGWGELRNCVVDMRTEMDSLSYNACNYINYKTKEPNWDKKGVRWTIGSIFVMIVVFLLTSIQTKKQVISQHEDTLKQLSAQSKHSQEQINSQRRNTNRHIKTQRNLTQQQISEMHNQSEARLVSLEKMGNKIEGFTGKIQESVKHFERTFIGKDDRKFVDSLISEIITENEKLYLTLFNDFVDLVDISNADKNKYSQGVVKIKTNIDKIQNTLKIYSSTEPMPDAQDYLEKLQKIANGPDFDIMDEQLVFYDLGKTFCDEISHVAIAIFNNYDLINTQAS